jgi:hypothetical protein
MATYIKAGIFSPPGIEDEEEYIQPMVYIDEEKIQVLNEDDELVVQFTYEELRGLMAIMAAEQEKQHLFIKASAKNN